MLPHKFDVVSLDSIAFFRDVGQLMKTEPLQIWREYLLSVWLAHISALFSDTFQFIYSFAQDPIKPDRSLCRVDTACSAWFQDASHQFIESDKKHLVKARTVVQSLVSDMKDAIHSMIATSTWDADTTKKEAFLKLQNMEVVVGWPDDIPIIIKPQPIIERNSTFDECILRGHEYQFSDVMDNIGTPADRRRWRWESSTEVNAFYSRENNTAYLPAALFYEPFVYLDQPNELNTYCAMGCIVAHELAHSLDYDSRYIDGAGYLRNWWHEYDEHTYMLAVDKTVQLYNRHQRKAGRNTLSENIADLLGLDIVWQTFLVHWRTSRDRLPSIDEAHEFFRMYVISQAQLYMENSKSVAHKSDLHALAEVRINVPLATFTPFIELYKIRRTDPMYIPIEKRPKFI
jgi:putative endopeptidase